MAAGSAAYGVYLIRQNKPTAPRQRTSSQTQSPEHHSAEPEPEPDSEEHVVDHGSVVQPSELQGHGTLYFVPMGRQVIPVQSQADYYEQKFQIKITVLAPVEVESSSCVPARHQCSVEAMILQARHAYPQIARAPDAVMIILTDEDIYPRSFGWKFT
jgi:hypothetical protein